MADLQGIAEGATGGNREVVASLVQAAVDEGTAPERWRWPGSTSADRSHRTRGETR